MLRLLQERGFELSAQHLEEALAFTSSDFNRCVGAGVGAVRRCGCGGAGGCVYLDRHMSTGAGVCVGVGCRCGTRPSVHHVPLSHLITTDHI